MNLRVHTCLTIHCTILLIFNHKPRVQCLQFVSPELDEYGDPIPRSAKTKTKSATESKHPTISDKDSLWYNPDTWNKSTKVC